MMYQEAKAVEQQLLEWRRQIHRHPELGKRLPQTTDLVKRALDQLGGVRPGAPAHVLYA